MKSDEISKLLLIKCLKISILLVKFDQNFNSEVNAKLTIT